MEASQATTVDSMSPQKHTMSVLAQISSWMPDKIIPKVHIEAPVQQTLHVAVHRPVEFLKVEQHYRMLRYRQGTEEEGDQGQH